jgi:hypothetical protein
MSEASAKKSAQRTIVLTAILDVVFFALGVAATYVPGIHDGGTAVALVAIGTTTFIGFYFATADMRLTIAATFVLLYIALLPNLLLNNTVREVISSNDFAKSIVSQFTTLVGSVVAFYLGASALVERTKLQEKTKREAPATEDAPEAT